MRLLNKIFLTSLIAIWAITSCGSGCMDIFKHLPKSQSIKYTNAANPHKVNEIKYLTGPAPSKCTNFANMRLKNNLRLVFVDKNSRATRAQADGSTWEKAVHSIGHALLIAKDKIRVNERFDGIIYIIIAGGNYGFSHENHELSAAGHPSLGASGSIISLGDKAPGYNFGINIYGGYHSGAKCLEDMAKSPEPTNLDGENQSNHVISIMGDATDIELKHLGISRGYARIIDQDNGGGILITDDAKNISFENIAVTDCKANNGAALAVKSPSNKIKQISIKHSQFANNEALNNGGAIYVYNSQIIAHENNLYLSNRSGDSGGAIYVEGSLDSLNKHTPMPMKNIHCHSNYAPQNGGCVYIDKAPNTFIDGGIYEYNGYKDSLPPSMYGGAIYYISNSIGTGVVVTGLDDPNLGDGDFLSLLKINKAQFFLNKANMGGAIFTRKMFNLEIDGASFEKNQANNYGGGAIYIQTQGYGDAYNNDFRQGANLSIKNSNFKENSVVSGSGGAIYADTLNNFLLSNDNVTLASMYEALLERRHNQNYASMANLRPEENIPRFLKNSAPGPGGALYLKKANGYIKIYDQVWLLNKSGFSGGAIYIADARGEIHIKNPLFSRNSAAYDGGAIYIRQAVSFKMDTDPLKNYIDRHKERFDIYGSTHSHADVLIGASTNMMTNHHLNHARGIYLIRANKAKNRDGGAIYLGHVNSFTLENMSFAHNNAELGRGGAIFVNNLQADALIKDSIIYASRAYKDAGAMWIEGDTGANPSLTISNSNIQKNTLPHPTICRGSAGIYGKNLGSVTIDRTNFFDNTVAKAMSGSICAASMKLDSLALKPGAFSLSDRNADGSIIEPIQIKGNKVITFTQADDDQYNISGTIFIPANIHNYRGGHSLAEYFRISNNDVFEQEDNSPWPDNIDPHNIYYLVVQPF